MERTYKFTGHPERIVCSIGIYMGSEKLDIAKGKKSAFPVGEYVEAVDPSPRVSRPFLVVRIGSTLQRTR